jgi:hypothetical protein
MTDTYRRYQEVVDSLLVKRAVAGWKPEDDRQDLTQLMDLFELLSDDEKERANAEGLGSWP